MSYIQEENSHECLFKYKGLTVQCVEYVQPTATGFIGYVLVEDETAGYFKREFTDTGMCDIVVAKALCVVSALILNGGI